MRRKDRISKGVRMLQKQGYRVEQYTLYGRIIGKRADRISPVPICICRTGTGATR